MLKVFGRRSSTHAILRYLAARHGSPRFWPADAAQRTSADSWMDWTQTRLQPDFIGGVFWGLYRTPEQLRNPSNIRESIARCDHDFALLERVLAERPFLCTDTLSLELRGRLAF
jgi:glutathione S-transferase